MPSERRDPGLFSRICVIAIDVAFIEILRGKQNRLLKNNKKLAFFSVYFAILIVCFEANKNIFLAHKYAYIMDSIRKYFMYYKLRLDNKWKTSPFQY